MPSLTSAAEDSAQLLLKGKTSLESGDYEKAIALLTAANEKLPFLGDYALLWRSRAYEGNDNLDKALADVRAIKEKYKESRLVNIARLKEMELLRKKGDPSLGSIFESMVRDYPSSMEIKYAYAQYLKENNDWNKARELYREVFISTCPLSAGARNELSTSEITVEDLVKKGKALNVAWRFKEAENVLREALAWEKAGGSEKEEVTDTLAYSLFSQKRYREAAELYKKTKNIFGRARSLFRAGDMDTFQAELPEYNKAADKRMAEVIIAYGTMKRREGKSDEALKIFDSVPAHYPSAKEEALWAIGWTHYLSRDYNNASKVFSQLATTHGDSKYLYWSRKCMELSSNLEQVKPAADYGNGHDFYAYLTYLKSKQKPPSISKSSIKVSLNSSVSERVDTLATLGFKDEASAELLFLSRKDHARDDLISISSYLEKLGNYKAAVALVSRIPYDDQLHELYYPLAFWSEVKEASEATSLDPYLILSVIREESRYEPEAQSIAGAVGLMQLMPQTARHCNKDAAVHIRNKAGLANIHLTDSRTNVLLGSSYLKQLLNKFGSIPLALASYNGGEDAVSDWVKKGKYRTVDEFIEDIPYGETRNYVKKVMTTYFEYLRSNGAGDVSLPNMRIGEL